MPFCQTSNQYLLVVPPAELYSEDEFDSSSGVEDYFAELSESEDSDDEE